MLVSVSQIKYEKWLLLAPLPWWVTVQKGGRDNVRPEELNKRREYLVLFLHCR